MTPNTTQGELSPEEYAEFVRLMRAKLNNRRKVVPIKKEG